MAVTQGTLLGCARHIARRSHVSHVDAVIAMTLTRAVVILALSWRSLKATGVLTLRLSYDLPAGLVIILIGWGLARIFCTPEAQPSAPPTR